MGCRPMASSSSRKGFNQFARVFKLTPALWANSDFDIAFIIVILKGHTDLTDLKGHVLFEKGAKTSFENPPSPLPLKGLHLSL